MERFKVHVEIDNFLEIYKGDLLFSEILNTSIYPFVMSKFWSRIYIESELARHFARRCLASMDINDYIARYKF